VPETNEYQDVKHIRASHGRVFLYPENTQRYLQSRFERYENPMPSDSFEVFHEFEVTLYDIATDFSKIKKIYPYNRNDPLYSRYTGKNTVWIDPHHPTIRRISQQIAKESKDPLEFARNAYNYVVNNFNYQTDKENHSLTTILKNSGGDCVAFSFVFVSLLRSQGIPARTIYAVRPSSEEYPDVSFHCSTEFYLERYGWIPVDATIGSGDKKGDYFGHIRQERWHGVIVLRDFDVSILGINREPMKVGALQMAVSWHSGLPNDKKIDFDFRTRAKAL
jgi:transglutaminase-like putative cysteine protease